MAHALDEGCKFSTLEKEKTSPKAVSARQEASEICRE